MKLRRPTDDELATLEPVHMTKDEVWDPSKYDTAPSDQLMQIGLHLQRLQTLLWNRLMVQLVCLHGLIDIEQSQQHLCVWC